MDEQPRVRGSGDDQPPAPPTRGDAAAPGFSTAEKVLGAAAAYRAPVLSSLAASELLRHETDPVRRRQLTTLRKASLIWAGVGALVAVIVLIVIVSVWSSSSLNSSGACRGEKDITAVDSITYQSGDGVHWTVTYPCDRGGSTTVPIARSAVPGGGR